MPLACGRRDPIDPQPPVDPAVEPTRVFANELVLRFGFGVEQARQVLQ